MSGIRYKDKLLPTQNYFANLYQDGVPYEQALYDVASRFATDFTAAQFKLATPTNVDFEEMSTPPSQLAFFNALVQLSGAKKILEIGTFVGHCTMQFSRMVGEGGHVTTIEIGKEFAALARKNFHENGFDDKIALIEGSAREILGQLPKKSFDLIFIDGSKQDYLEYALVSEALLSDRGMIVVDDVFFHGDALNVLPSTEKGIGCKKLLDHYDHDRKFTKVILPISNGILLLLNRPAGR
jgi:caffeoyl-CoA O-methyltransferase